MSRGRSGTKRKPTRRKKNSSPTIPKTLVVLAVAVLVVFVGGLYFISHHKSEDTPILPTHAARPGNGLPPKPEERWRYIKELENRQLNVQTPTEPTSGGDVSTKPQLTPEQRQLLEQMQADMRQQPTQLAEVPYNDPNQPTRNNTSRPNNQQQMQQPVRTPPLEQQAQQKSVQKIQEEKRHLITTQSKPVTTQTKPEKENPKSQVIAGNNPEKEKPQAQAQEKTQHFLVQCGSFHGTEQAESARAKLAFEGFEGRITSSGGWNRVVIGPYNNRASVNNTLNRLKNAGITGCIPLATGG